MSRTAHARSHLRLFVFALCIAGAFVAPAFAQAPTPSAEETTADRSAEPEDIRKDPRVDRWRRVFGWGLLLLVIFITSSLAIIVFTRRFRAYLQAGHETPPTSVEDVWAMHKLPESGEEPEDSHS